MPKAKSKKAKKPTTTLKVKKAPARKRSVRAKRREEKLCLDTHRSEIQSLVEKKILLMAQQLIENPFKECAKPQVKRTSFVSIFLND